MIVHGRLGRVPPAGSVPLPRGGAPAAALAAVLACLLGIAVPLAAATAPSLPPPELAAYSFVTRALDATATLINPAGLARAKGTNLYLDLSGDGTEILEGTAAMQGGSWAFTYRHRDLSGREGTSPLGVPVPANRNADTYAFATGLGPPRYQIGISRVWTNVDVPGEDAGTWNAGFMSRPSPRVTLGFTVENIQHPRFLNGRLTPRYTYALSLGLLPSRPNFLVLTGQGSHLDGAADRIDVSGGLSVHLPSGVDAGLVVRRPFGGDVEVGATVTRAFGRGAASARVRSVSGTDQVRGQLAIQVFDEIWQRSHGNTNATPTSRWGPRRRRP
jgi:hypothetical protein